LKLVIKENIINFLKEEEEMRSQRMLMFMALVLAVVALPWGINPAQAGPGGGTYYANSPAGGATGTALRKFVDRVPGLGLPGCTVSIPAGTGDCNENGLGQYIPIAKKVANPLFPNDDYYELGIVTYTERMHSDLSKATRLRGYKDIGGNQPTHYLGPLILAQKDKAVRLKVNNQLGASPNDKLFIPVDTTMMGAGMGPLGPQPVITRRIEPAPIFMVA
jgi:hypothetical protein